MKLLKESGERSWYLVKEWKTKAGLEARIHQCVWKERITRLASLLHPHYCGYVRVLDGLRSIDQNKLDVHGGVTFGPGPLGADICEGTWIGFDMAHFGDENNQDLDYATEECERLAEQINAL